ncbi:MAG: hypothetical protein GC155_05310 [Alphaproteobacteria bacterium]|nr:hypothetical protein [Alphaproteobacteria bacterium]
MAQTGYQKPPAMQSTDEHGARPNTERARQGQKISGMMAVLVVGTVLVAIAFGIMLALRAQPPSVTDAGKSDAAAATSGAYPVSPDQSNPRAPTSPPAQQ